MSFLRLLASVLLAAPLSLACAGQPVDPAPAQASTADTSTPANFPLAASSHRYRFSWDGNLSGEATRSLSCQQQLCSLHMIASVPGIGSLD